MVRHQTPPPAGPFSIAVWDVVSDVVWRDLTPPDMPLAPLPTALAPPPHSRPMDDLLKSLLFEAVIHRKPILFDPQKGEFKIGLSTFPARGLLGPKGVPPCPQPASQAAPPLDPGCGHPGQTEVRRPSSLHRPSKVGFIWSNVTKVQHFQGLPPLRRQLLEQIRLGVGLGLLLDPRTQRVGGLQPVPFPA